MSITFPTTLDTLPNPTSTDLMENATLALDHDQQHANANDAIEALEAKVGINSSAVTTSHDYKLSSVTGNEKALTSGTSTQTVSGLTLTSPVVNVTSDATGDIYYRSAGGLFTRLAAGATDTILSIVGGLPSWISNPSTSNASTTVKGVVEAATAAEINAGTATGATGAVLAVTPDALASSNYATASDAGIFGDGSDGAGTISGTTTLTRDMNYTNLTINSGQILNTDNFRVFVSGTFDSQGTVRCNGLPGVNATGGTAVAAGTLLGGGNGASSTGGGGAGGSGAGIVMLFARTVNRQGTIEAIGGAGAAGATSGVAGAGSNGTTITTSIIQSGTGGAGGVSGGGHNGGTGGVITTSSKISRGMAILLLSMLDGTTRLAGGAGGASGGTNGGTGQGGGGGGQGGVVVFVYHTMTTSGTVTVTGGALGALFGGGANGVAGSSGLAISIQV
jgi:hypothetical protein